MSQDNELAEILSERPAASSVPVAIDDQPNTKLRAFFEPDKPLEYLGMKLRRATADSDAQMELIRFSIRRKLATWRAAVGDDDESKSAAEAMMIYYGLALILYVHSTDDAIVSRAAYDPTFAESELKAFMGRFTRKEIEQSFGVAVQILDGARKARDWNVQSEGIPPPNLQAPSGSRPM